MDIEDDKYKTLMRRGKIRIDGQVYYLENDLDEDPEDLSISELADQINFLGDVVQELLEQELLEQKDSVELEDEGFSVEEMMLYDDLFGD